MTQTNHQQATAAGGSQLCLSWFVNCSLKHSLGEGQTRYLQQHRCYSSPPVPLLLSVATSQTKTHHAELKQRNRSYKQFSSASVETQPAQFKHSFEVNHLPVYYLDLEIFNIRNKTWVRTTSPMKSTENLLLMSVELKYVSNTKTEKPAIAMGKSQ